MAMTAERMADAALAGKSPVGKARRVEKSGLRSGQAAACLSHSSRDQLSRSNDVRKSRWCSLPFKMRKQKSYREPAQTPAAGNASDKTGQVDFYFCKKARQ
jgi:hypothetical protein